MNIELRQILEPIASHRVVRNLVVPAKTLLTFRYDPNRNDPEPYIFKGEDLLAMAGLPETGTFKAYIVGVEPGEKGKVNYHILENFQNLLVVNKHTNFQLFDVVPVVT